MPGPEGQDATEPAPPGADRDDEARHYAAAILDTTRQPLLVLDGRLRVETANRAFYRTFLVDDVDFRAELTREGA